VAEALSELRPGVRFLFVGGRRGFEAELATAAGLPFHATPLASLRDPQSRLAFLWQLLVLPVAVVDALVRVARFGPSVCLTSGGFGAMPALLAARALRVPIYLWEGNVVPGRTNRALAGWSKRIGVTFPDSDRFLPRRRVAHTGNPIRRSLLRWERPAAKRELGIADGRDVVLVTGGSQGSERVNEALFGGLDRLARRAVVLHHTGPAHLAHAQARRENLPEADRGSYVPRGFFKEDMGAALAAADVVVARAGSSSIAEPLAFGIPLVLIPFGASMSGHQDANARSIVERGAAVVIRESELSGERLAAVVIGLLDDPARLERMREAARRAGRPDAAVEIAREVLALGKCA
jgi:UDP-N-acetylglucosamine--N-acetylmuramyl-(pentapeptide) pyrophosphoryl-undecaprenol N-acetylglucosamine transferase